MSIGYCGNDYKLPKKSNERNLSYSGSCYSRKIFMKEKYWREAIIEGLEQNEVYLVGRNSFTIVIENLIVGLSFDCIVYPSGYPLEEAKHFCFSSGILREGSNTNGRILKDFNE